MELRLQKPGEWQGTALVPVGSDTWAVFAFMSQDNGSVDIWAEQVLGWVMADRRFTADELGTVFYGLSLQSTRRSEVYRGPDICEGLHDKRGCHIGYSKNALAPSSAEAWQQAAREHMKRCQRRRAAMSAGPGSAPGT